MDSNFLNTFYGYFPKFFFVFNEHILSCLCPHILNPYQVMWINGGIANYLLEHALENPITKPWDTCTHINGLVAFPLGFV